MKEIDGHAAELKAGSRNNKGNEGKSGQKMKTIKFKGSKTGGCETAGDSGNFQASPGCLAVNRGLRSRGAGGTPRHWTALRGPESRLLTANGGLFLFLPLRPALQ